MNNKSWLFPRLILHYWRGITVMVVVSVGGAAYMSFSQADSYVCEVEFVPPDFSMASPLLRNAALVPGNASDLERVLGYLRSFSLRQELIDSLRLYEHYALNRIKNPSRRAHKLEKLIDQNIIIRITKNATICIQVYDNSPDFCYQVAVFLLGKAERFCRDIIGADKALMEKERQLQQLIEEMRKLEETLARLRVQYRILTSGEKRTGTPYLLTREAFAQYDRVLSMESRLIRLQETYANLIEEKARREDVFYTYRSSLFIIQPPYKPPYPLPSYAFLWIFGAFLGSLALAIGGIWYAYSLGLLRLPAPRSEDLVVSS